MNCGTPTPATTRVVQIEPGPMPTFTAETPALISASAPSAVATLPPTSGNLGEVAAQLARRSRARPASGRARCRPRSRRRRRRPAPARARACPAPTPTAAPQRSRPSASLQACGKRSRLLDVLDRDQAAQLAARRPPPAASRCGARAAAPWRAPSSVPGGTVTRSSRVITLEISWWVSLHEAQVAVGEDADGLAVARRPARPRCGSAPSPRALRRSAARGAS